MCDSQQEVNTILPLIPYQNKAEDPPCWAKLLINSHVFQPWCCDWIENTNYNFIGHAIKHDVDQEKVQGVSY